MKYQNAHTILPEKLVAELQKYIQGDYLYIPIRENARKTWGESSGYRQELRQRNAKIRRQYAAGASVNKLSEEYSLSVHAIRKILYQKEESPNRS